MLKPYLLSGWFRIQPLLNYLVVFTIFSPFLMVSVQSTFAKQLEVVKSASGMEKFDSISQASSPVRSPDSKPVSVESLAAQTDKDQYSVNSSVTKADHPTQLTENLQKPEVPSLANKVDLSPPVSKSETPTTARVIATPSIREIPVDTVVDESEKNANDPIGSPHPIPWNWIIRTQEEIASKGGSGLRNYRSLSIVSPDGRYSVYSRVQMQVKPEMYNSRVTSVLFVEDKKTRKLQVMAATSGFNDPLLNRQLPEQPTTNGTIEVLVPVSWSEKSDRFLARKFVGLFNTADVTDNAVIWDRQQNHLSTVTPTYSGDDHEKIAVLLGWSKKQPNNVLFRAGELGQEHWPLVQVNVEGKTITQTAEGDQPITFGERNTPLWAQPQVAYR